jgi:hypothetical protein
VVEIGGVDGLITPLNICYTPESGRGSSGLRESVVDPKVTFGGEKLICRGDVLVQAEEVVRVVDSLDLS